MKALFDRSSNLVGWMSDDQTQIYDTKMSWVGFTAGDNAWNSRNDEWIGPVINGNVHDQKGRAIVWSNSNVSSIMPAMRPMTPMKPMTPMAQMHPMTPLRPLTLATPTGGWSQSSFGDVFR